MRGFSSYLLKSIFFKSTILLKTILAIVIYFCISFISFIYFIYFILFIYIYFIYFFIFLYRWIVSLIFILKKSLLNSSKSLTFHGNYTKKNYNSSSLRIFAKCKVQLIFINLWGDIFLQICIESLFCKF